jgi:hypothetical protein
LAPVLAIYGALALGGACANVDTTLAPATAIDLGVTAMAVDPADFLGGVECSGQDGGMGSYVATLVDVTDPTQPFALPSSPPTPCSQVVYFQYVNPGDLYSAVVDGYAQSPAELVPECGALPPGAVQPCAVDSDCAPAYGCQGTCKVTTYQNASVTCFQGCATKAGSVSASCIEACVVPIVEGTAPTKEEAESDFQTCVLNCGVDANCASLPTCLGTQFAALQNDCPTQPQSMTPDASGELVGAVKACSCAYLPVEGSQKMFLKSDPSATTPVAPLWPDTACGSGDYAPVESVQYLTLPVFPCTQLLGPQSGDTTIVVEPDASLGALFCASESSLPGGITSFDVVPSDPSLPVQKGLPCPSGAGVSYTQGVTPETNYTFTINAYQGGSTPTLTTDCTATPAFAQPTYATCDVLVAADAGAPDASADGSSDDAGDGG